MSPVCSGNGGLTVLSRRWCLFLAGWFLSSVAGLVNGVSTVAVVIEPTTHLSGRVNYLLHDLAFDLPEGLLVACIICCFVGGGAVSGWLVPRLGCGRTLLVAAVPLALGTVLVWGGRTYFCEDAYTALHYGVAAVLAFGAGLQNGATSQSKLGRTTHVTGDLTDMGLAIAQANWWLVAFLFTKSAGFAVGGVAGFLGVRHFAPTIVLLAGVKAIILAALALLLLDRLLAPRPARAEALERADAG